MADAITEPIKFKYLDLPMGLAARGGGVRFYLLANDIPLEEELITLDDWFGGLKQAVQASGESPLGVLPVVYIGDVKFLQHIATLRHLARRLGTYGRDLMADHRTDAVADEYVSWRNAWAAQLLADDATKAAYAKTRPGLYGNMQSLLKELGAHGAHSTSSDHLTFADALLFALLWDDVKTNGDELLKEHTTLLEFYEAFKAQPAIAEWCATKGSPPPAAQ